MKNGLRKQVVSHGEYMLHQIARFRPVIGLCKGIISTVSCLPIQVDNQ